MIKALGVTLVLFALHCVLLPRASADGATPDLTLKGHTARVNGVCFSPDSKRLASVADDGLLKLWDLATGRELFTVEGVRNNLNQVRFTADGKTVVALGSNNDVLVVDAVSGKPRAPIPLSDMPGGAAGLDVSPDGKRLAVVGRGTLRLFELPSGAPKGAYEVHKSYLAAAVTFSADGSKLLTVGTDKTALVIDPANGKTLQTINIVIQGEVAAFSHDGKTIFTYGNDRVLRAFDLAGGEPRKLMHDGTPLITMGASSDGKALVLGGAGRGPVLIALPDGGPINEAFDAEDRAMSACFSPDAKWIAGGANEGTVYVWKRKN